MQQEYGIGQILGESWQKFRENFLAILLIVLVVYIPVNILLAFVPLNELMAQRSAVQGFRMYLQIIQILQGLIGIIAIMAIAYLIKSQLDGKVVSFGQALKKSLSKWPAAIGTNIILGIFLLGLTLLFIVPGVIYGIYWMFAMYAVILNDKFGKKALDYSKAVVKGRWWRVLWYSFVFGLFATVVGLIAGAPHWFLPENAFLGVVIDTWIDVATSYFIVVSAIFFIRFDQTKKGEKE